MQPRDAIYRRGGEHGGTVDVNRECNSLPVTVEQFAAGLWVGHAQTSAGTRITFWRSGDRAIGESALALDSSNEPVRTESETVMRLNENKGRTAIKLGFGVASALLFATVGCGNETAGTDDSTQPAPPGSSSGELSATMDEAQQDQVLRLRAGAAGRLSHVRILNVIRIAPSDLAAFITSCRVGNPGGNAGC